MDAAVGDTVADAGGPFSSRFNVVVEELTAGSITCSRQIRKPLRIAHDNLVLAYIFSDAAFW